MLRPSKEYPTTALYYAYQYSSLPNAPHYSGDDLEDHDVDDCEEVHDDLAPAAEGANDSAEHQAKHDDAKGVSAVAVLHLWGEVNSLKIMYSTA